MASCQPSAISDQPDPFNIDEQNAKAVAQLLFNRLLKEQLIAKAPVPFRILVWIAMNDLILADAKANAQAVQNRLCRMMSHRVKSPKPAKRRGGM